MVATATQAVAVTPSDSVGFSAPAEVLWIGTGGNVSLVTLDGGTAVYTNVPAGYLFQACTRVNLTGTTASGILALYISDL